MAAQAKVAVTVSIPVELYERLAYYAVEMDTKPSTLARALIASGLDVAFAGGSDRAARYAADKAKMELRMRNAGIGKGE